MTTRWTWLSSVATAAALLCHPGARAAPDCTEIRAKRVLTPSLTYQSPGIVVIRNGIIEEIGKASRTTCEKIQLGELTVLPGLIDAHTHLFARDRAHYADFSKELLKIATASDETRTGWALESAREFLLAGITTIRDLGNSGLFLDTALRNSAKPEALVPNLFLSGPGISGPAGQFAPGTPSSVVAREYFPVTTRAAIQAAIDRLRAHKVDWVKVYADGEPNPAEMPPDLLASVVGLAKSGGLGVAAHATNDASALRAVRSGVQSIEHGYGISEATLREMSTRGIFLVPTDLSLRICEILGKKNGAAGFADPKECMRGDARRLLAAKKLGTPLAFGSDSYGDFHEDGLSMGQAALEGLFAYVDRGLSPADAVRMATEGSAKLLGQANQLGRLKPGARADIIAVAGDPLVDLRALRDVRFVMKSGRTYKNTMYKITATRSR